MITGPSAGRWIAGIELVPFQATFDPVKSAGHVTANTSFVACCSDGGQLLKAVFKSSGVHRKVGSVGSIPMHLRHLWFQ